MTYHLRIPNVEVRLSYQDIFLTWYDNELGQSNTQKMIEALTSGNVDLFGNYLADLIRAVLSYYDTGGKQPERVYHAFILGLLAHLDHRFHIRSNRESGYGRYDLMMVPKSQQDRGIIMEFKVAETPADLDTALTAAMDQMAASNYRTELKARGVTPITEIGVAFCGKKVKIEGREQ